MFLSKAKWISTAVGIELLLMLGLGWLPRAAATDAQGDLGAHLTPQLGEPASEEFTQSWDIGVMPDGMGLPAATGNVEQGKRLYDRQCASCHGPHGVGASADALAGGNALDSEWPDKTVGNYWPYATSLFDFIRRSMPMNKPGSLSNADTYALTAYILHINGIIAADASLDAQSLPDISMPNHNGFIRVMD
ncbi:MAG: c-type cytochrome [Candidatus Eutrophobiaceae bacterium]